MESSLYIPIEDLVRSVSKETLETMLHMCSTREIMSVMMRKLNYPAILGGMMMDGAFYHDIGKVFFPNTLHLTRKLSPGEFDVIKMHIDYSHTLLTELQASEVMLDIARYHHEHMDGSGYLGMYGESIPEPARIMAIVDVYDALRGKRAYKDPFGHTDAVKILLDSKSWFDPGLLDVFLDIPQTLLDSIILHHHNADNLAKIVAQNLERQTVQLR